MALVAALRRVVGLVSAAVAAASGRAPCDIYAAGKTPCVAAHSIVRPLFVRYTGPLYTVRRPLDNATLDIFAKQGFADTAAQDKFCGLSHNQHCTLHRIFDQSPHANHLNPTSLGSRRAPGRKVDAEVPLYRSSRRSVGSGRTIYAAVFDAGMGYRNTNTSGIAKGDQPESMYAVLGGDRFNDRCCFDYGNAELHPGDAGPGTMEAISWTNGTWGMSHHGVGQGPWIMADLENGLFGSNQSASKEPSLAGKAFVTAMVKGDSSNHWAIKGGDAGAGQLVTLYDGVRPCTVPNPKHEADCRHPPNYNPMRKQGGLILGVGGDNSHGAIGTWYEGAVTAGYSTDEVDDDVQASIVATRFRNPALKMDEQVSTGAQRGGAIPRRLMAAVQLFVDPRLVANTSGAEIVFGPVVKARQNPLFAEDMAWEGANRNTYPTAAWDPADKKYKLWYNTNTKCPTHGQVPGHCPHLGYPKEWLPALRGERRSATLYAESSDGISWHKPSLGIVSWNGSTSNNIVLDAGSNDYNRGVLLDLHDSNASRRFKLFGGVNVPPTPKGSGMLRTAVSPDGKVWTDVTPADSMEVAGDTANNAVWDPHLQLYIAFSRRHCLDDLCHIQTEGSRRETRSTSTVFLGGWSNATECAHGEGPAGKYEMYSLTPFRSPEWSTGLYFAVGSFYAESAPGGRVYCELMSSHDYGSSWRRLAPHKPFIQHSADGDYPAGWDSHTCYAANGLVDTNGSSTRFY